MKLRFLCALFFAIGAHAQDDLVRLKSPDGQIELQLFIATPPEAGALPRAAYQVLYRGKPLIAPSYLGLNIHNQEPFLGEKIGLIGSKASGDSLIAEYMQNGSLGRLLNIEARVFDDGVAFRYVVPWSSPLEEILIDYEATEFHFAKDVNLPAKAGLPIAVDGTAWVAISEKRGKNYPPMFVERKDSHTLESRLIPPEDRAKLAFEGKTPMSSSWRVLAIGATREAVLASKIADRLP